MYHVETQERNYNSVDSPEQFQIIRTNWEDYSPVVRAFHWINPYGWVPIDPYDFESERMEN
jgi:hypothetical protein